jgi:hypothetical protein
MQFNLGDRVKIFGVKSEGGQKYNGKVGIVKRYVESKGRYGIKIDDYEKLLSVKPRNLLEYISSPELKETNETENSRKGKKINIPQ